MEKRDLYDKNKKIINKTIFKYQEIPENCYILMVVAFIQNNKNEFLIQKRSEAKGGQWAFTGGHPKSGETSLQGLLTEVKEEIGITVNTPILFKEAQGYNTFCDLYYVKQDFAVKDVVLQEEEVSEVKFATVKEIEELFKKGEFKKGHYMMFKDCLEYLNKN